MTLIGTDILGRLAAILILAVLSPILVVVAIAILLDNPGPVFYRQRRTGYGGVRFGLWKFRTMVVGADSLRKKLANQYSQGTLFKMENDPRVTRVGRFLRRTSLDELPQLMNVICGEMALVGPRPTSAPLAQMPGEYKRRILVKPGLTGLWQVSGRSTLTWEKSVALDLHYVENHSPRLDLKILARTIPAVLKREGAF